MIRIGGLSSHQRMADDELLLVVLNSLRERGAIGEVSLPRAIAHAESFVDAVPPASETLLDLGSGGGLPGLVIAVRLPHVKVSLVDRRERRMDLLRRACHQLGVIDHVDVVTADVRDLARKDSFRRQFDVVTARSFGEPLWTLRCAAAFLRPGGSFIVSEPPDTTAQSSAVNGTDDTAHISQRWPHAEVSSLGFTHAELGSQVRSFTFLRSSD